MIGRGRRLRVAAEVGLLIVVAAIPAVAQQFTRPELHATRAVSPPIIDGALNDEAWQSTPLQTGEWLSYSPLNGDRVPQLTTVWLSYDDDYLYFAFKCDDPEPSGIKTSITRRDNIWNDDWVGLSLDALGTGQISYHMMINPNGVQLDLLNSAASNEESAPDWLWDSAGRLTDTGYAVEVRLPLKSIRFKGGQNVRMGLLFFRRVSRLGVSVAWPPMPAGVWVFERHAALFFDNIKSHRVREVLPSATFSRNQLRESPSSWNAAEQTADFGFSTKVGLTPTITLDATVNPDFSQVESDAFQVEVNQRFPIFFAEKRPFFMEGMGIFALAGAGGDNSLRTAIHTRRIVDPSFGAKLTGSAGRVTFGGLAARDNFAEHDHFFSIGRAQYSLGPSNYIGALFTDTTSTVDGNRVFGTDLKWRVNSTQRIDAFALFSRTRPQGETQSHSGVAAQVSYSYETDKWTALGSAEHYDDDFDMATAFINRVGITGGWGFVNRSWYPDKKKYPWIRRVAIINFTKGGQDRLSGGGSEAFTLVGGQFNFTRQGFLRVQRTFGFEHWQRQRFENGGFNAFGSVQLFHWLSFNGGVFAGSAVFYDPEEPFQGRAHNFSGGITFQPSGRFTQDIGTDHVSFDRESTGEHVYTVTVVNTKTTYQFTRAFALRGLAQYDSSRRRVLTDFLASYEPRPGTVVYAGYGSLIERRDFVDGQWVPLTGTYRTTQRGLFFKASYLYRF
jgi:Domain of unknown function (DUF5916)/Carbohydrate family 9 binding domain-like